MQRVLQLQQSWEEYTQGALGEMTNPGQRNSRSSSGGR